MAARKHIEESCAEQRAQIADAEAKIAVIKHSTSSSCTNQPLLMIILIITIILVICLPFQ